eukprot:354470-Chlamydomonas_euryale.AAC.54
MGTLSARLGGGGDQLAGPTRHPAPRRRGGRLVVAPRATPRRTARPDSPLAARTRARYDAPGIVRGDIRCGARPNCTPNER